MWWRWYSLYFRFMFMSICFLDIFYIFLGWFRYFGGCILLWMVWFILLIGILLHWIVDLLLRRSCLIESLYYLLGLFIVIPSLVILYSDDYMFHDLSIFRFILSALMLVVCIMTVLAVKTLRCSFVGMQIPVHQLV